MGLNSYANPCLPSPISVSDHLWYLLPDIKGDEFNNNPHQSKENPELFFLISQPATISLCVTSQSWSAVNPVADQLRYDFYFLFSPKSGHKYRPTVSQMSRHTQCLVLSEILFLFRKVQRTRQKFSPIICIIVSAQLIQFTAGAKRLPLHILKLFSRVWL